MKDQEEIGRALYLLRAGADPEVFLKTLRAYVLQHTETPERMAELLHDLSSVNPRGFVAALNTMAGRPLTKAPADDALRAIIDGGSVRVVKIAKTKPPHKPAKRKRITKHTQRLSARE